MFSYSTIIGPHLKLNNLQHIYDKWGPSARRCVQLGTSPIAETWHEHDVKMAAKAYVMQHTPGGTIDGAWGIDPTHDSHILFSIHPLALGEDDERRGRSFGKVATDQIREFISYAAAEVSAQD